MHTSVHCELAPGVVHEAEVLLGHVDLDRIRRAGSYNMSALTLSTALVSRHKYRKQITVLLTAPEAHQEP